MKALKTLCQTLALMRWRLGLQQGLSKLEGSSPASFVDTPFWEVADDFEAPWEKAP